MGAYDGKWFWLVLLKVPVSNIEVLRERGAIIPSVHTRLIAMARMPGREPGGAFGITSVTACANIDGVCVKWIEYPPGRRKTRRSEIAPCNRHIHLQFPDHLVFARAFTVQEDAEVWRRERTGTPVAKEQ